MAPRRLLHRLDVPVLLVTTTILLPLTFAQPARALVVPHAAVNVTLVPGGFKACFVGTADASLGIHFEWQFAMAGARSDLTTISLVERRFTNAVNQCFTVFKQTAAYGGFTATLNYVGGGFDVLVSVTGDGYWSPMTGDQVNSMSL